MPSAPQSYEFAVGEDVEFDVQTILKGGDTLASWQLQFQLMDDEGNVLFTKSSGAGITVTGADTYTVDLTDGSSYNLAPGRYRFETRIVNNPKRARDNYGYFYVSDNWSS